MNKIRYLNLYYDNFPKEVRDALKHTNLCVDPIIQCNPKSREDVVDWIGQAHGLIAKKEFLGSETLNKKINRKRKKLWQILNQK
jgi:hypothetical protein